MINLIMFKANTTVNPNSLKQPLIIIIIIIINLYCPSYPFYNKTEVFLYAFTVVL